MTSPSDFEVASRQFVYMLVVFNKIIEQVGTDGCCSLWRREIIPGLITNRTESRNCRVESVETRLTSPPTQPHQGQRSPDYVKNILSFENNTGCAVVASADAHMGYVWRSTMILKGRLEH
jgi:hypothetical protein